MQAEVLYKLIEDCACIKGDGSEVVLDLFCGTGTIGLTLARRYILSVFLSPSPTNLPLISDIL